MSPRASFLLGLLATVAALTALWVLVVSPEREQASDLAAQVTLAEQARDDALGRALTAEQARATYSRDYATVARLGKAVPANADVPSLVIQLEAAARRTGVDFRAVSVLDTSPAAPPTPAASGAAPTAAAGGVVPAPFSFRFEGDFSGLQKLLTRVDRFSRVQGTQVAVNGRLLTIDGMAVNPGRAGLPQIQGVVTARAYVADLPGELPAPASASATTPAAQVTP